MLLCDSAQVAEGKLYLLGAGWSITGPQPAPSVVAIRVEVDWNDADKPHHWELYLIDEDGQEVVINTPDGPQALEIRGEFQVQRAVGIPEGSPLDVPMVVNLGPIPLPGGKRYDWRLSIDGTSNEDWRATFYTRSAEPPA